MALNHACHLEDLVLLNQIKELKEALDLIQPENISVKYDGSPAIVFGNLGTFIISTKSIFNKVPKFLREGVDLKPEVIELLKNCSIAPLEEFAKEHEGTFWQADLLFAPFLGNSKGNIRTSTPNICEYRFETEFPFGIALHSKYSNIKDVTDLRDAEPEYCSEKVPGIFCAETQYRGSGFYIKNLNAFKKIDIQETETTPLIDKLGTKLQSYVNLKYRGLLPEYSRESLREFLNKDLTNKEEDILWERVLNFLKVQRLKNKIIDVLNLYQEKNVQNLPIPCEGYMIKGTKIKLVNRDIFSTLNFRPELRRFGR